MWWLWGYPLCNLLLGERHHSLTDLKHNPGYNEEADVDKFYDTIKTRFSDKGVPVILGEYAAGKCGDLASGADKALHYKSVEYFHYRMVKGALLNGAIPFRWDTPGGIINQTPGCAGPVNNECYEERSC